MLDQVQAELEELLTRQGRTFYRPPRYGELVVLERSLLRFLEDAAA
jgi:hypothetical protein